MCTVLIATMITITTMPRRNPTGDLSQNSGVMIPATAAVAANIKSATVLVTDSFQRADMLAWMLVRVTP
jgi:hypothetical protein